MDNDAKKFWNFKNKGDSEVELWVYGEIAAEKSWWYDTVTPGYFQKELGKVKSTDTITVRVNSGGGDVFAATAIYTMLKDHPGQVVVKIDGFAASAATIIAMAGDKVIAPANALLMIHNPLVMMYGYYEAKDLESAAETLDVVKEAIMFAYESKTRMSRNELSKLMDKETWWTASQAKEKGFVDEIMFDNKPQPSVTNDNRFVVVNNVAHDLSRFKSIPEKTVSNVQPNKEESIVEIKNAQELRDKFPDFVNEIVNEAVEKERDRLKSIDEISANLPTELVVKAKYEEGMTAEQLAFQALKNDARFGTSFLQHRDEEFTNSGAAQVTAQTQSNPGATGVEKQVNNEVVNLIAQTVNALRGGGKHDDQTK